MAATALERPVTVTGVGLAVVVPSPSWTLPLFPQHFTLPPVVMAQVWTEPKPAEIAATPLERPVTSTGVELGVVVPSPSSPTRLFPQHLAPPAVVTAHVWRQPRAE